MKDRKKDHISLAFDSQLSKDQLDQRFQYDPLFTPHPGNSMNFNFDLAGKTVHSPFWVSSMTGGTEKAGFINKNLAKACKKYKMGMGLGSCRILLEQPEYFPDFDMRTVLGEDLPLLANIGIAQLEKTIANNTWDDWNGIITKLRADGLIIHVNPLQEWMQPEGDQIKAPPIDTIKKAVDKLDFPIIVKEVGQGMGRQSLESLLELPLEAIDFAANGGTNFTLVELLRSDEIKAEVFSKLAGIGHSAEEMVDYINDITLASKSTIKCKKVIISGGIKHFLDGFYLHQKCQLPSLIGQASTLLKKALLSYDDLDHFLHLQHQGWMLSQNYLTLKPKQ
ncbi:isopentenyl-diphosphate delta-isomerase [Membranihabitans maritimus]|uniref:isopentenyl-diphosphate delta-isomerase n=1 Tax=Membranihabitans maritimus TaxID=2904244 RepID=UPI001F44F5CA|nr:isopentenyl-diphosphate delta-isomerase [Membranihabitans maritimus]